MMSLRIFTSQIKKDGMLMSLTNWALVIDQMLITPVIKPFFSLTLFLIGTVSSSGMDINPSNKEELKYLARKVAMLGHVKQGSNILCHMHTNNFQVLGFY
jgi:hypothetical protein